MVTGCASGEEGVDDPGYSVGGGAGDSGASGEAGSGGSGFGGSSTGGSGGFSTGGSGGGFGGTGGGLGGSSGPGGSGGGTGGTGGSAGEPSCNDPGPEPNDSEAAATTRPEINDCDGSGSSVTGMIAGSGDADWFKFQGDDDIGCSVNPYAFSNAVNVGARVCAFADCGGTTEFKSCKQGAADFSPSGRPGCCTTSGSAVELEINCPGTTEDSAMIYIRIDQPNANACIPYTLDYHY